MEQQYQFENSEKNLVTALAVATAKRLKDTLDHSNNFVDHFDQELGISRRYLYHLHLSAFEGGCDILWKLGVANGAIPKDNLYNLECGCYKGQFPAYFTIFPEQQIRENLNSNNGLSKVHIDEVIEAYLTLACDYGPKTYRHLPTPRNQNFGLEVEEQLEPLERFSDTLYVESHNNQWRWTDKIAPHMISTYLWNEKEANINNFNSNELISQIEKIRRKWHEPASLKIPDYTDYSTSWKALLLMRYWNGKDWELSSRKSSFFNFDEAIYVASILDE